ncbi:MAG: MBL fold metallo-hydrolase [Acetobacteraceae bacterium]|nr:MBL fold metallo-hydrolase [Acetobacteraceae bacterium]
MNGLSGAIIPVTLLQQNCTLLWDDATKAAWVIDPGGDIPRIREAIAELGLSVERVLLTHGHIDHAGGAALLRDALPGVPLEGPDERDSFLLDGLEDQGRRFGVAGARNVRPDRFLAEGEHLELAEHRFEVLHCPGHTPGHVVFVDRQGGLAVVGDVLFQGSVGRTDFPYGDTAALLASIRDKLMPLDDATTVLCGHGPGTTIGAERRSNPYVQEAVSRAGA